MIPLLSLEAARLAHLILCPAGRPQPSRPNMILSAHSLPPRQDRFEVGGMVDRSWCHHESRVFCVQSSIPMEVEVGSQGGVWGT